MSGTLFVEWEWLDRRLASNWISADYFVTTSPQSESEAFTGAVALLNKLYQKDFRSPEVMLNYSWTTAVLEPILFGVAVAKHTFNSSLWVPIGSFHSFAFIVISSYINQRLTEQNMECRSARGRKASYDSLTDQLYSSGAQYICWLHLYTGSFYLFWISVVSGFDGRVFSAFCSHNVYGKDRS